ncbi:hypothetical protein B0T19DRAFT_66322 [Cercophora scortea]|uniref:Uncharacterized protein n=1 Tax=Cercophora scortea TaxID=314031 RepID=A0AAE0J5G0_9PEZI|nr:hypothetical protein B0T19DRAFT_66322 [Cercophora scortea]
MGRPIHVRVKCCEWKAPALAPAPHRTALALLLIHSPIGPNGASTPATRAELPEKSFRSCSSDSLFLHGTCPVLQKTRDWLKSMEWGRRSVEQGPCRRNTRRFARQLKVGPCFRVPPGYNPQDFSLLRYRDGSHYFWVNQVASESTILNSQASIFALRITCYHSFIPYVLAW